MFYRHVGLAAICLLPLGCVEPSESLEQLDGVGSIRAALDACGETVPANRSIDGVPAYAQCATIEKSAIYSNNGIDTSATKVSGDWVRTQYAGGYQCTELAHRYLMFKWKVSWLPNGNAGEWCNTQPTSASGIVQTSTPVHGDLIVFAPGSCGADSTTGHVAVVDVVEAAKGKVTVVEQNMARRGSYNTSCGKCFLHVVANDGKNPGEPIGTGTPPVDAGSKPSGDAATSDNPRPARDAAVDSGAPIIDGDDEADDDEQPSSDTGKKDAGSRKDAGSKTDDDEQQADDEVATDDDEPARAPASDEGCSVAHGARGSSAAWMLLACVGTVLARRVRRARR